MQNASSSCATLSRRGRSSGTKTSGSRLIEINQVTLPCLDYDASVRFYIQLGLTHIVDSPPRYARFETSAGSTLSIHATEPDEFATGSVIYFEVDNVDQTVATLTAAGVQFDTEPNDESWLWREARLTDPAGNRLCIYHAGDNRRFPPWRI